MQFKLPLFAAGQAEPRVLRVGSRAVPLEFVRRPRARRYILRLTDDSVARVTIPRGGSEPEAREFADHHLAWLHRQFEKRAAQSTPPRVWMAGTELMFRGVVVRLEYSPERREARLGELVIPLRDPRVDLRPQIEGHLRALAHAELPARARQLAALHQAPLRRVAVRSQRSRWGSCSPRGVVSLNWRLLLAPPWVADYLILHELLHLREMNHSRRFWNLVAGACPDFRQAERWLDDHARWLR